MATMATTLDERFEQRIRRAVKTVKAWDADPALLAECRSLIPFQELNANPKYHRDDDFFFHGSALVLKRLCYYFQQEIMTWVNRPICVKCQTSDHQESQGVREAQTEEERQGEATRVEMYACSQCHTTATFPRYNSARKLLETRKGRCGEYANLFGVFCRATGFETRYVLDVTDHVWVECWCETQWIMADSCEGLIDKNSMYESGWGKQLSYQLGVTIDSIADVSVRYTRRWNEADYQARRRDITSSEGASRAAIDRQNRMLQEGLPARRIAELQQRAKIEEALFFAWKQATEWTEAEKHDRGRLSGSLEWKLSRQEVGTTKDRKDGEKVDDENEDDKNGNATMIAWDVEQFFPCQGATIVDILVTPGQICVGDSICNLEQKGGIAVVVLDDQYLGCILQSRSFRNWGAVSTFIERLPSNRIVAMQGVGEVSKSAATRLERCLGGFPLTSGPSDILFIGQVDAHPDWAKSSSGNEESSGIRVSLTTPEAQHSKSKGLKKELNTIPHRVTMRLPETHMPLATQLLASSDQKKAAFVSFGVNDPTVIGYVTRPGVPIYLLGPSSFPFRRIDGADWETFHRLPEVLVPEEAPSSHTPLFDIPIDAGFFTRLLGENLLQGNETLPTKMVLHNTKLVALYFSAHWCGPCRQFTPMLATAYSYLKEEVAPVHGLEIVFVTSDRDDGSFRQYYSSMPWAAMPFNPMVQEMVKMRYQVRGIPSLIVLDAMSGQVVVPASASRSEVIQACRSGEQGLEQMLESWMGRIAAESQEIVNLLEVSLQTDESPIGTDADGERKEHAYCVRRVDEEMKSNNHISSDSAAIVKELFSKLVENGMDPNAAAAKAIKMASEGRTTVFGKGSLKDTESSSEELTEARARPTLSDYVKLLPDESSVTTITATLLKYIQNAVKDPSNPKFRGFKLSNKIVDRITSIKGGLDVVEAFGFQIYATHQDFCIGIPLDANLEELQAKLQEYQNQ